MAIKKLKLLNFRSYDLCELEFCNGINYIYGNNALGKTNVIEAIYITCITKSFRADKLTQCVQFGKNNSSIICEFDDDNVQMDILLSDINEKLSKKTLKENGNVVSRYMEYIGRNPVVLFSPDDMNLTKSSPKVRRRFLDVLISQINKSYVYSLSEYNKLMLSKNSLLKQDKVDNEYLEVLNFKLAECISVICKKRQECVKEINKYANVIQKQMSNNVEELQLQYSTDFETFDVEGIRDKLNKSKKQDILRKVASYSITHDDIDILLNGKLISTYGSQGQNRTAILSIKLSELEILKEKLNKIPIILLDDVFSELDESRIEFLMNTVLKYQVIITATEKINSLEVLCKQEHNIFHVSELGVVKKEIK